MSQIQTGKKKKNKGKQHMQNSVDIPKDVSMEVDLGIVQKYSFIGVSPPLYPEEMEEKIKEIEAKKAIYVEKDASEIENAAENHKQKIEEELAEAEAQYKKDRAEITESLQRHSRGAGRGQRGGRGRDNNDGYRQNNRGRGGRGGRGGLREREERPERRNDKNSDDEADEFNQEFVGREDVAEEEFKPVKAPKK